MLAYPDTLEPVPPTVREPEPPWDSLFVWAYLILGQAAACWILWCPFLGHVPDTVLVGLAGASWAAVVTGRLDSKQLMATATTVAVGGIAWWGCHHHFGNIPGYGNIFAYLSIVPAVWLLRQLVTCPGRLDTCGLWALPRVQETALGCWAVGACGVSSILIEALHGMPGTQIVLTWFWMTISIWPTASAADLIKVVARSEQLDAAVRAEVLGCEGRAVIGIWGMPWLIASGAWVLDILTKRPFDAIINPSAVPLYIEALPFAVGLSAFFSQKLLLSMLTAPMTNMQSTVGITLENPSHVTTQEGSEGEACQALDSAAAPSHPAPHGPETTAQGRR